jgi:hypothetical protein
MTSIMAPGTRGATSIVTTTMKRLKCLKPVAFMVEISHWQTDPWLLVVAIRGGRLLSVGKKRTLPRVIRSIAMRLFCIREFWTYQ